MTKFVPHDLNPYFNSTRNPEGWHPAIGGNLKMMPAGKQVFWGIPFDLGPIEGLSWLVLDQNHPLLTIPVSGTASYLMIAHFCDASHDPTGKGQPADYEVGDITRPGELLAEYMLVYADGSEHDQPIRRRFEVGEVFVNWGQQSFAAKPHLEHVPVDWRGPFPANLWGWYQSGIKYNFEANPGNLVYWIYALENPHRERELASLRVKSTGASRLAIAGVTTFLGEENPLRHRPLESLRVELSQPKLVEQIESNVDLGIITRKYIVPSYSPEDFLKSQIKGLGEEERPAQPVLSFRLDITSNPDATLSVDGHAIELRPFYETGHTQSSDGRIRVELLNPERTWVHVVILDEANGQPTPARVHFHAVDGNYLPPHGHRREVNDNWFEDYGGDLKLGSTQYAYVDGRFQIELPVGESYVEVVKGFEYSPVRQRVDIQPGQRELALKIGRGMDWRAQGWVTADTHVHFISPQTAWLEAQAEGVNLVNLLASQWGELFTNVADITGDLSGVSRNDTLIYVGTENRQHLLGHMSLLGGKGEPVFPMCAGGPDESYLGDPLWSSLAEWSDRCRARDGLVVIPHFPFPYGEVAADIVLGKIDAAEIRYFSPSMDNTNVREWYRFLNCGYRVAAVGGTDKMNAGMPVGGVRTYAFLGEQEFTFPNWAKAVRAGRTFTSSGPLISLRVEGNEPGDEINLPEGGGSLHVDVWAKSAQPFHELQVLVNGEIVARKTANKGMLEAQIQETIHINRSAWVAARCFSHHKVWHSWWPIHIAAHTSPVYIRCGGADLFNPSDATYMLTLIDGGLTWLNTLAIPASTKQHAKARKVFEDAWGHLHHRLDQR